jgi:hypothetical protein
MCTEFLHRLHDDLSLFLEKLMYNKLMAFIVGNQVLSDVQRGFRANKSTETALQSFIKCIQEAIEDKLNPTGIFLDVTQTPMMY